MKTSRYALKYPTTNRGGGRQDGLIPLAAPPAPPPMLGGRDVGVEAEEVGGVVLRLDLAVTAIEQNHALPARNDISAAE